jgi:glutamine synthetase
MQIIEEVTAKRGLTILLQETPFNDFNVNHNNWPLPPAMVSTFWHLMSSLSIASPGNDFRLGACEAPPAIVSSYLGESMTEYLETFMTGSDAKYSLKKKTIDLVCCETVPFQVLAEDRNCTPPSPTEVAVSSSVPLVRHRTCPWCTMFSALSLPPLLSVTPSRGAEKLS